MSSKNKSNNQKHCKQKKKTCRTCLLKNKHVDSIFAIDPQVGMSYQAIVTSLTGLQINENDGFTEFICYACKQNARVAIQFINHAKEADCVLRGECTKDRFSVKLPKGMSTRFPDGEDKKPPISSLLIRPIKKEKSKIEIDILPVKFENDDGYHNDDTFFGDVDYDDNAPLKGLESIKEEKYSDSQLDNDQKPKINFCPVCDKTFPDVITLLKHARTHEFADVKPTKEELKKYKSKLTGEIKKKKVIKKLPVKKTQKCIPKAAYKKAYILIQDMLEVSDVVEYIQGEVEHAKCGVCNFITEDIDVLRKHYEKFHFDMQVMKCTLCSKYYMELLYLRRHLVKGHAQEDAAGQSGVQNASTTSLKDLVSTRECDPMQYPVGVYLSVCPQCGELTFSYKEMLDHNTSEHEEFKLRCSTCTKIFRDEACIQRHKKFCGPLDVDRQYVCTICGQKFMREQHLASHVRMKHVSPPKTTKPLLPCYMCDKMFKKMKDLDSHKFRKHRPLVDGKIVFQCHFCGVSSDQKYNLKKHLEIHEPNRKPLPLKYVCSYCGKQVAHSGNLITHIRRFHTGEKPYKCNFCPMSFVRSVDCTVHQRKHTGVKPYSCQYCGYRFSRSHALRTHLRVHTGEKPYKCCHCGQGFAQVNDCRKHERRHTGELAYVCLCGQRFVKSKDLQEHKATCSAIAGFSDEGIMEMKRQMELARCLVGAPSVMHSVKF